MHILQPKHTKLNEKEEAELLSKMNLSKSQLPKIFAGDAALPQESKVGDIIKIERKDDVGNISFYYRVVV